MSQQRELEQERRLNLLDRRLRLAEDRIKDLMQSLPRAYAGGGSGGDDGLGGGYRGLVTTPIPTGTFASPSSGLVQLYHKDGGGVWTSYGDPVQVFNHHTLSASVAVGKPVHVVKCDGDYFLFTADCP